MDRKTLHLIIYGRVQGVFYRDSMRSQAQGLSVAGWVRNRSDGTVEALVQGEAAAVDMIVQWAHRGPPHARVERVEISFAQGEFRDFDIVR